LVSPLHASQGGESISPPQGQPGKADLQVHQASSLTLEFPHSRCRRDARTTTGNNDRQHCGAGP